MKRILLQLTLILVSIHVVSQEEPVKDLPVREPFASGLIIDNQTTVIPTLHTLEYFIQHKFGNINNGFADLFGIYAPGANIRMGLNFVPLKNLQVGYGLSRIRMYSDFAVKYTLVEQTRSDRMPVAVGVFANGAIDGRNYEAFGNGYKFSNRFSYFTQLIVGRKFNHWLSVQVNASFTHYNATEVGVDHDKIAIGFNGRVNLTAKSSIIFQYDMPLKIQGIAEHREFVNPANPNIGIGWEIRTSAHAFHLYLSSTDAMIPQHGNLYNQNDWTKGDVMFGFTITRLYNFF
ncbi:MAG: DUF5777 family beta-barrel protein [Tenuifilaceae bacterium]|jgi:hypothetical protein|nr:DUF5777 family beta-barrel protein [Tenuifilaceae bacterium]